MTEDVRLVTNRQRLQEANPVFRAALARALARLQALGFRPRVQQCWRSPEEQQEDFARGVSHLRWGFHNATTPDGKPDALAADVLDDDHPLNPTQDYLFALARTARAEGLATGIDWDLPMVVRAGLNAAIAARRPWTTTGGKPGPIGWDPIHVQVAGLSVADAEAGTRPTVTLPVNA